MAADKNLGLNISATDSTAPAFASVKRSMEQTTATAQKMGADVQRVQGSFGNLRGAIQQASFQVGDFAVQVASGGSAVTALVQQGSQMLGVFGAFGALAGAALAIGGVAWKIYEAGKAAENTRDAVADLVAEIKRLNGEAAKTGTGVVGIRAQVALEDLRAEYDALLKAQEGLQQQFQGGVGGDMAAVLEGSAAREASAVQARIEQIQKLISEQEKLARQEEETQQRLDIQRKRGEDAAAARDAELRAAEERERAKLKAAAEAARETDGFNQRMERTMESIRGETERYNQALDGQARRLREQIDPNVAYAAELERIGVLLSANKISADEYGKAAEMAAARIYGQTQRTDDITRQLGLTFSSAFEDAILRGEKLRSVLGGIAQDIGRLILRQTVTKPAASFLDKLLQPIGAGIAGAIGGLFGGGTVLAGDPTGGRGPGFLADGGPATAGQPYIVGEEGPELFVPRASGTVLPNGTGIGGGVVIHQTINVQAGVAQTVRAEMLAMLPRFKRETIDAVADARQRGGRFAAAMGA